MVSAGQRSRGRGWRGQERVKGGASPTNTRTRSLLRPVAGVPPALSRAWGRGPAQSELTPSGRAPWPRRTHAPARAHTSDIPIVPHVTPGPNVPTLPTRSRTRAHTLAHNLWPLPNSALTPVLRLAKALIDGGTPTLIHRHTLPPHASHSHTFINRAGRSTHAPPRCLLVWEP